MYVRWVHCTKSNLKAYWEKKTEITISPLVQATKNLHEFEDAPEDDVQAFIKLGGATMWWKKIQLWIGRKKSKRGSDFEENTRFAKLAWTSPAAKSQKVKKDFGSGGPGILPVLPMPSKRGPHHQNTCSKRYITPVEINSGISRTHIMEISASDLGQVEEFEIWNNHEDSHDSKEKQPFGQEKS